MKFSRRGFLATAGATLGLRAAVPLARSASGRRVLHLVYDKSLGMMRAVDRIVP